MPVTAKLSRKFYDTFGDDIANELVEWFNQVDATYRSDLRELNELNFQRFDARLEQRVAELRADFDRRFTQSDAKLGVLEAKVDQRVAELRAELLRWMFVFWVGTIVPLGGLIVALMR